MSSAWQRARPWLWLSAILVIHALPSAGSAQTISAAMRSGRVSRFATTFDVSQFLKGNLHTHTNRSDGDSSPEDVIGWYRSHGYQFLALTDHNRRSEPEDYPSLQDDGFRLIPGEEITMTGGGRQVHVNALCTKHWIGGGTFHTPSAALARGVNETLDQDGVALVNHPNFDRALSPLDLLAARGAQLLEIKSGHPYAYSDGLPGRPSHEELWQWALEHDLQFMGVAVDDTHHLAVSCDPPAYPGRAWVEVFAAVNDESSICDALRRGNLYASTGAELSRIRVTAEAYSVWPRGAATVAFLGRNGKELERVTLQDGSQGATYTLRGTDTYVRAHVITSRGSAWTPPVWAAR